MKTLSNLMKRWVGSTLMVAALAGLSGCATTGQPHPSDPLESFNRAMFSFNDGVDSVALKPAATVYANVLPSFVQTGVGNFFGNLADVWTSVNNFLQGKVEDGLTDMMRVALNSTLGLGGLLDIGSEAGLPKHKEDFGQTLGKWGFGPGPYVVLPLFGPSTLRDTVALPVDLAGDPWSYVDPSSTLAAGSVVRVVDLRAAALEAGNLVEDAALDRYSFIRDAFLQRRESKVYDGEVPRKTSQIDAPAAVPTTAQVIATDASEPTPATEAAPSVAAAETTAAPVTAETVAVPAVAPAAPVSSGQFKFDQNPATSPALLKPASDTVQKPVPAVAEKATKAVVSAQTGEQ